LSVAQSIAVLPLTAMFSFPSCSAGDQLREVDHDRAGGQVGRAATPSCAQVYVRPAFSM
jgi:hypothetical protein